MTSVLALTLLLFTQFAETSVPKYSAQQITPSPGQVVYPGQTIRVEWSSQLPRVDMFESCESEVRLSIDGGRTFPFRISPYLIPKARNFYWTVPNMPTSAAVLDIRFGCDPLYPESFSPQLNSMFVIASSPGDS